LKSTRLRIGYLAPRAYEKNGVDILKGVYQACRHFDLNLICIEGGIANTNVTQTTKINTLSTFKFVNSQNCDGLVTWSTALAFYIDEGEIQDFLHSFFPLPLITLAQQYMGIPAVTYDNAGAIRQVMRHLVEFHGLRRIGFVQGKPRRLPTQERFDAYKAILLEYGIPFDPELVTPPGDFTPETGRQAVRLLVGKCGLRPKTDIEALVSPSDKISLGIVNELVTKGFRVPEDIAVTGFNNSPESVIASPTLTTLDLQFFEVGYRAVELLHSMMQGKAVPENTMVPAILEIRRSCGCIETSLSGAQARRLGGVTPATISALPTVNAVKDNAVTAMRSCISPNSVIEPPDWAERLYDAFIEDLGESPPDRFLTLFRSLIQSAYESQENRTLNQWQDMVSDLRQALLPSLVSADRLARAENIWHRARVMVSLLNGFLPEIIEFNEHEMTCELAKSGSNFNSSFSRASLFSAIEHNLASINLSSCYFCLYKNQDKERAKLMLAIRENQRLALPPDGVSFHRKLLLPKEFLGPDDRYYLVAVPCFLQEMHYGYLVFDLRHLHFSLYENLRLTLTTALKGAQFAEEQIAAREEREKLLKVLESKNTELEKRAREIYKTNTELERAIALANQANRAKSIFLANMSHEMRTPLTVILGFSEILKESVDKEEQERSRKLIADESNKLLKLINQLLDLSKIEAGKFKLESEPFDVHEFIGSIESSFRASAKKKNLEFYFSVADDIPAVLVGDAARVHQILDNLVGNAVKFTHEGEIRLAISLKKQTRTNVELYFQISDTGIGISRDRLDAIFEPFTQADENTGRTYGGTGLGTTIAKQFVILMGGDIGVESELDKGSTFWFTITLEKEHEPLQTDSIRTLEAAPAGKQRYSILVAEDYTQNREVVRKYLDHTLNCEVTMAENGKRAVEQARKKQFDLILMDIQMPIMDGCEATSIIRNELAVTATPIIAMSANAFEADIRHCIDLGMNDYITKPFLLNEFKEKVLYWLKRTPQEKNE
jgi:signal transduction histidine kinase/DNA-binding LacI/PurR family transcriptional regulator/ActR/RegA family two-component response regulator